MTAYTTIAEMRRLFSTTGVDLLADENGDGEVSTEEMETVNDAIDQATGELNLVLLMFHEEADLAQSKLVRRWATYKACHYLSQVRANASKFNAAVERIDRTLDRIIDGQLQLTEVPFRANFAPSVRNHTIDDRFRTRKSRVKTDISTGDSYPGEDADYNQWEYGFGY